MAIRPDNSQAADREGEAILQPKEAFWAKLDPPKAQFSLVLAVTRAQATQGKDRPERTQYRKGSPTAKVPEESSSSTASEDVPKEDPEAGDLFERRKSWEETNKPPSTLVHLSAAKIEEFVAGY